MKGAKRSKRHVEVHQVLKDFSTIHKLRKAIEDGWQFEAGDKVRLNMDAIKRHPGYEKRLPAYREFCEKNAERVFTVAYVDNMNPSVVCFAEDKSEPKWLFWIGDLKAV